jgi:dienelactone hydrolase
MRIMKALVALWAMTCGPALATPPTPAELATNGSFYGAELSPSGRYLAGINVDAKAHYLVIVDLQTRQSSVAQMARHDQSLELDWVDWKSDERLIFSVTQRIVVVGAGATGSNLGGGVIGGYPVTRIYTSGRNGANPRQLFEGNQRRLAAGFASTFLVDPLPSAPDEIMIGAEGRGGLALFRANLVTGALRQVDEGTWSTMDWYLDRAGNAVMRVDSIARGTGYRIYRRGPGERRWVEHLEVRKAAEMKSVDFVPGPAGPADGQIYVVARPQGTQRASVYLFDSATAALGAPLFDFQDTDVLPESVLVDTRTNRLQAACGYVKRLSCRALDESMAPHFSAIEQAAGEGATAFVVDRSDDGLILLVHVAGPASPDAYCIYTPSVNQFVRILPVYPGLRGKTFAPTATVDYTARDGHALWGYLTVPAGQTGAAPLVVMPHGGPEARDLYEYDPWVQSLAARGYAVFQPQFRGSEGFGRAFTEAGYRQWGQRMQDDVTDGVRHLIAAGKVDAARVCIVGASYGGYAALAGAAFTPDMYKCAVSVAGVFDLPQFLDDERKEEGRGSAAYGYWLKAIGDPGSDRAMLEQFSPARHADAIRAPVLLIHGEDDGIVLVDQSRRMKAALDRAGKTTRLIEVKDSGHFLAAWSAKDREMLYTEIGTFLDTHIGAPRP